MNALFCFSSEIANLGTVSIGVGRFRILGGGGGGGGGGARFRILGVQGGPNSQQAHDVVLTSMRRNDVASTSFRRHVPTRFWFKQYLFHNTVHIASQQVTIHEINTQYNEWDTEESQ